MPARYALLLPVVALLMVGVVAVAVVTSQGSTSRQATPAPLEATQPAAQTRLDPRSNVCQGVLHRPDPSAPRAFPATYTQRAETKGITIVADASVSPQALVIARQTIERVFKNNTLADALADQGAYVVIADSKQGVLDLPEFGCLQGEVSSSFFSHVCGIADRADYPVATANELDLLGNRNGPCAGLNILYHEVGHLVQGWTLAPSDYFDIKYAYQAALDAGKYRGAYAATNSNEYFAEATQAYFFHGEPNGGHDRAWLKAYDPDIYALVARIYGD